MAKLRYRSIACCFWSDPEIIEQFTPDEKLFYLYLLTNEHTEICGVYRVLKKHIMVETGFTREVVDNLLDRFQDKYDKIIYDTETQEVVVRNWLKYQNLNSQKVVTGIQRCLENVRNRDLVQYLRIPDTISIEYPYPIDTHRITDTDTDTDTKTETETITLEKTEYRDGVFLTKDEYEKLVDKLGADVADELIEELSVYILGYGKEKKYKSHYHTILAWNKRRENERRPKSNGANVKSRKDTWKSE